MYARLMTVLAAALAAGVGFAQPPAGQPPAGAGARMGSFDGTWTVVSASRDGRPVDGADRMTVTIRDGVATFGGGAGAGGATGGMRAMRVDFGPHGTMRVMEAGSDGRFGPGPAPGTGPGSGTAPPAPVPPGGAGTPPGAGGTPPVAGGTPPGATGGVGMTGVYVLAGDYLAIAVHDNAGPGSGLGGGGIGTPPGTRPGGTGVPTPGSGPAPGGTGTQPGGAGGAPPGGTGATPPGGPPGAGPAAATMSGQSHVSVVLRRSGGGGAPGGAPGRP